MDRTRISSTDRQKSTRLARWQTIVAIVLVVCGWIVAAVFVRLALDWSDSQPYEARRPSSATSSSRRSASASD